MIIKPIKSIRVTAGSLSIFELLDSTVNDLKEGSVLAITSKVVSLCENRVVPIGSIDKEKLIKQEADYYLPAEFSQYEYHFTITNNTLISMSGIDESNGGNNYVLWPQDPQKTANDVRAYLKHRFRVKKVGVVITDSTCMPLRLGTVGIALSYSGFLGVKDYVGTPDLFGRAFKVSHASIASGLAATAVLSMGEGTEQTPLCILEDLPFVEFQPRDPSPAELEGMNMSIEEDLFGPFINAVKWQKGKRKDSK